LRAAEAVAQQRDPVEAEGHREGNPGRDIVRHLVEALPTTPNQHRFPGAEPTRRLTEGEPPVVARDGRVAPTSQLPGREDVDRMGEPAREAVDVDQRDRFGGAATRPNHGTVETKA